MGQKCGSRSPRTWRIDAFAPEERNVYSTAESLERTSPLGSGSATSERRKGFHAITGYKHLVPTGTKPQRLATSGCFKISANPCKRLASAALFAVAALLSKDI